MSNTAIRVIVGLGNPGIQYRNNRHNVGFWLLDELCRKDQLVFSGTNSKLRASIAKSPEFILARPSTYMNESGFAVQAILNFYKLQPPELLVVHDELDLPVGTCRLKFDGGHGGHNGLRSIMAQLGNCGDFLRLRLGIGHPGDRNKVHDYVLSDPKLDEHIAIEQAISRSLDILPDLLAGKISHATKTLNTSEKLK